MHFIVIFSMAVMSFLMINVNADSNGKKCNGEKCDNNQVCAKFCDKAEKNNEDKFACGFNGNKCPKGYTCHNGYKSDMQSCNPEQHSCPTNYICQSGGICIAK
uniref:Uncharacterized protein n=1 Tax=Meloidogyne floridensis TaxID=298350 RepID=A0A915NYK2_9BILA